MLFRSGHSTRGKLTFSVGDHVVEAGGGSDFEEGVPTWVWAVGGGVAALVIAVIAGVAVLNRKAD